MFDNNFFFVIILKIAQHYFSIEFFLIEYKVEILIMKIRHENWLLSHLWWSPCLKTSLIKFIYINDILINYRVYNILKKNNQLINSLKCWENWNKKFS
jgi:hypothetical protein